MLSVKSVIAITNSDEADGVYSHSRVFVRGKQELQDRKAVKETKENQ